MRASILSTDLRCQLLWRFALHIFLFLAQDMSQRCSPCFASLISHDELDNCWICLWAWLEHLGLVDYVHHQALEGPSLSVLLDSIPIQLPLTPQRNKSCPKRGLQDERPIIQQWVQELIELNTSRIQVSFLIAGKKISALLCSRNTSQQWLSLTQVVWRSHNLIAHHSLHHAGSAPWPKKTLWQSERLS